ncbi:MAG TPA: CorA family divalent cation transporter [Gemmatimonadales bacterium]|nr:CorA family divalent cation transporter [Gemmatimonadales bacterium]
MSREIVVSIEEPRFTWIDITAPAPGELEGVAAEYGLFPTLVADSLEPEHLPKYERIADTTFVIVRAHDETSHPSANTVQAFTRKVAIFAGQEFVITIHRVDQPFMARLRARYREHAAAAAAARLGERRRTLSSRLLVDLINGAIDTYERPLDVAERRLDEIEDELFAEGVAPPVLREAHSIKRQVTLIKRMLWHTLNVTIKLTPVASPTAPLFQDAREGAESMHAYADELLEDANNLLHIQLGLSTQRTNGIVRILTLFSAFFLPLTFIVGIYGMNFERMPELDSRWGYPAVWLVMLLVTLGIFAWFRRRGWLGE